MGKDDSMLITWTLEEDFDPNDSIISLSIPKSNIMYADILDRYVDLIDGLNDDASS